MVEHPPLTGGRPSTVVLVGLRGAGKTTIGRAVADDLGLPFCDADDALAAAVGRPAGEWLAEVGEAAFREREEAVLVPLLRAAGAAVIATGGGAITIPAVRAALAADRLFPVWLTAPTAVLVARLAAAAARGVQRPALTGLDAAAECDLLRSRRDPLYAAVARLTVDTSAADPATCVAAIVRAFRRSDA